MSGKVEGAVVCQCGAPCRKEVLMRGGDYGWGDDASRTVLRYVPPADAQSVAAGGEVVAPKYPDDGNGDDDAYNRGWNDCLAALATQHGDNT